MLKPNDNFMLEKYPSTMAQKRVSVKVQNPNPLFEKWLSEWRDEAASKGSKMEHCFNKALVSLKKYPLPLATGRSCKVLEGFGDRLCAMLDKKLTEHRNSTNKTGEPVKKKARLSEKYVPGIGTGGYAILVTLYAESLKADYPGFMLKNEIVKLGQRFSDHSFSRPDPGTFYTAWSSMKTLLGKSLVLKTGNPAKFSLTEEGVEIARKLHEQRLKDEEELGVNTCKTRTKQVSSEKIKITSNNLPLEINKPSTSRTCNLLNQRTLSTKTISSSSVTSTASVQEESVIFAPGSFDVILIVDTQETSGVKKQKDDDAMLYELTNTNVPHEVKHLKVGDYTWICRERTTKKELVLPYIVERKRVDDFGSSIKDGRFHEQKFRLKQCGLQNLIYLVESYGKNDHTGLPFSTLQQAATNTLVQDGFCVKFTENLRGTAEYLSCMTEILTKIYKAKTLISCSKDDLQTSEKTDEDIVLSMHFAEFNKSSSKNKQLKVKDLFVKQLLQLKGVSVDKALGIVEKYPTLCSLISAYRVNPGVKGEKLLATVPYGKQKKNIGPALSRTIYQLYTQEQF